MECVVEWLYIGCFHVLLAMRNGPCSQYSPVKIPFKMLHFTNKGKKSQALQLQSYLPIPIYCLPQGRFPRCSEHWENRERNLLKLIKEKCPGIQNLCTIFFRKKKKSLSQRQSIMQILQVGLVCIRCAVLLNKKPQPNKKQAQLPSSALHPLDTSMSKILQTSSHL